MGAEQKKERGTHKDDSHYQVTARQQENTCIKRTNFADLS